MIPPFSSIAEAVYASYEADRPRPRRDQWRGPWKVVAQGVAWAREYQPDRPLFVHERRWWIGPVIT